MATTFGTSARSKVTPHRDAQMAFRMAVAMTVVIVAGFSLNLAMGRSSFAVPIAYHVHAVLFFVWTALFLTQTRFAASGKLTQHRRLGRIAALLLPFMVLMGVVIMVTSLRRTGGPFFFAQNEFFWGNLLLLFCFAGLVATAIRHRRQTDWHCRFVLTGMAILTGPGFGRILPMPLFIPWAWQIGLLVSLVFPLAGMVIDKRRDGAVHPAWLLATGVVLAVHVIAMVIAYTPMGIAATQAVVAGTPGAARPMAAFLP